MTTTAATTTTTTTTTIINLFLDLFMYFALTEIKQPHNPWEWILIGVLRGVMRRRVETIK
jgi:hypothetical protein